MPNDKREDASRFFLGAGLVFYLLAASVIVFIPWMIDAVPQDTVKDYQGKTVPAPVRTDGQEAGRKIYLREGCWLCHSQFVRGDWERTDKGEEEVSKGGDEERYGPISQAGESWRDIPHVFGTRRIGPDLAREGGKFADAWHVSHFLNPEAVSPGSIMPKFTWLYVNVKYDDKGEPISGDPTVELLDLISYVQSLGTGIGDWRGAQIPAEGGNIDELIAKIPKEKLIKQGKELFHRVGCVGCHGPEGRGNGAAAATFPDTNKPRNFHHPKEFKYGHDQADIRTTISHGRPPYMPAHPQFKPEELASLAAFVLSLGEEK